MFRYFKSKFSSPDLPFTIFAASVLILLTVPKLFRDGMFLDGMLYTSVAHNLGKGIGTFWQPVFSPFWYNAGSQNFHEHPPLAFGIQALFYKVLGDSMYVERLYIFLTMAVTAFLIAVMWRTIFRQDENVRRMAWLPVLLWFAIPTTAWSYTNNMMENTMGLFALAAVIFALKGCKKDSNRFLLLALSGLFVFLATMSKGIPGFFPLGIPLIYWLIFRKGNVFRPVLQTLVIILVPAVAYFILFKLPESRDSLMFYVNERLLQRIREVPSVGSRFHVFGRLFSELIPLLIITAAAFLLNRFRKKELLKEPDYKHAVFCFCAGLAASAPLALTKVQSGFYLVPSFPYFAVAFSILIAPSVSRLRDRIISGKKSAAAVKYLGISLLAVAIALSVIMRNEPVRDKDLLHDVHLIGKKLPNGSAITVTNQVYEANYTLECYFIRYYNIGLHINEPEKFMLALKEGEKPDTTGFSRVKLETRVYDLYERK